MPDEEVNIPFLPIAIAEAALTTLDRQNDDLSTENYVFDRETLYHMLRDVARMAASYSWDEGRVAPEFEVNPYTGTYWTKNDGEE